MMLGCPAWLAAWGGHSFAHVVRAASPNAGATVTVEPGPGASVAIVEAMQRMAPELLRCRGGQGHEMEAPKGRVRVGFVLDRTGRPAWLMTAPMGVSIDLGCLRATLDADLGVPGDGRTYSTLHLVFGGACLMVRSPGSDRVRGIARGLDRPRGRRWRAARDVPARHGRGLEPPRGNGVHRGRAGVVPARELAARDPRPAPLCRGPQTLHLSSGAVATQRPRGSAPTSPVPATRTRDSAASMPTMLQGEATPGRSPRHTPRRARVCRGHGSARHAEAKLASPACDAGDAPALARSSGTYSSMGSERITGAPASRCWRPACRPSAGRVGASGRAAPTPAPVPCEASSNRRSR